MAYFRNLCEFWRALVLGFFVVVTIAACDDSTPQRNNNQGQPEQQPATDIVKAHAPESEIKFLDAAQAFSTQENGMDAPNALAADEIQKNVDSTWRNAVLGIGHFEHWAAYVSNVSPDGTADGTIELQLSKSLFLKLWADVPLGGTLGSIIMTLRGGQPVYISGRIADRDIAFTKRSAIEDNEFAPTCFENGFGTVGCKIELESIMPF